MKSIRLQYIKCNDLEQEYEIEDFWLQFKRKVYEYYRDDTLVDFKIDRTYQPAIAGDLAGVVIQIALTLPSFAIGTIELWKILVNHFRIKRDEDQPLLIYSLSTITNFCEFDLYTNKKVKNYNLISSKKLIDNEFPEMEIDDDSFIYANSWYKQRVAEVTFKTKTHFHKYIIDCDGEIHSYERTNKKSN